MRLEDLLDDKYPDVSFHDAVIQKAEIDYVRKQAIFNILMYVGDPNSEKEEDRDAQRLGQLIISDLLYCAIEPPDKSYPYHKAKGLWVSDDGPIEGKKSLNKTGSVVLPDKLPDDAFAHYFFINDWNAFIYFAAKNANFTWLE